ncbi:Centrosome and spindle pole associated protein 1, variant 2 [Trebouxia sp. C0010 RCD-2024]
MAQIAKPPDHVKGLLQGGPQTANYKEQRQQNMAGYAAELQAQIAEKEKRRKLQRQESLRQSQDLLAQRMTVPSGLLEGVPSQPNRASALRQASQPTPPAGYSPSQLNRNSYPFNSEAPLPGSQSGAADAYQRPPAVSEYGYRQPSGSQDAYFGQADSPQSSYQPPPAFNQQSSYDQRPDYGRSNSDSGRADAGLERSGRGDNRSNAESNRAVADTGMGRGSVGNSRGPAGANMDYPERNTRGAADVTGHTRGGTGYPEGSQGYGRLPVMPAGMVLNSSTAQPGSPSAADAKKATYRAELEAQMKAREEAKKKQRADQLQEDLKVHRESAMYDPWGKGGGGAPHRSPAGQPISDLHQMRSQGDARQSPAPQQGPPSGNYGQYPQQLPPQQAPPNSFQQGAYADPQRQQADPRTGDPQPPPRQQRPPAPVGWAEDSQSREMPLDGAQGNAGYGQVPSGRRHVEPFSPPSQNMGNDRSEFGMGRRGVGEFGRGGGQNASRGQTPPSTSATTGTGAASVMALGQNKLPQRAEVYFRSDKANMQPEEIAAKQQQASELQDELRKQIEEKKRVKQEQQRQEKEEDAREQARLQTEQEKLKQQFAEEKEAEKAKRVAESGVKSKEPLNKRASLLTSSGSSNVQDHMQRQPTNRAAEQLQREQSASHPDMQNSRRGVSTPQAPPGDAGHAVLPGSSTGGVVSGQMGSGQLSGSLGGGQTGPGQMAGGLSSSALLQSASGLQMPYPGQAFAGLADANGSAMLAARQAAAAQLDQFRAEMVAEAAKMRAAVERQQAEVAELNRRAQHAEQESSAARAEAAAVRQAAAQQQAERAIAQYSHANRMAGLPFQDAQSVREFEPLPGLGFPRPRSDASYYSSAEPQLPSSLAMWSATNPGDYGASLRDSAVFRRPMSSGTAALDRPDSGAGGGWHPALDSGLDQSMAAESTLIYPKARPPAPASLRQSSASVRPEGAPAAEASHPGQEEAGLELQAEVMSVPLRGQGGAATPLTDVGLLFAQNQSKLQALKVRITIVARMLVGVK